MAAQIIHLRDRPWAWTQHPQHSAADGTVYSHGLYVCYRAWAGGHWRLEHNGLMIGAAQTLDNVQHLARSHADAMGRVSGLSGKSADIIIPDEFAGPQDDAPDIMGPNLTALVCGLALVAMLVGMAACAVAVVGWAVSLFTQLGAH